MDTGESAPLAWSLTLPGGLGTVRGTSVAEVLDEAVYVIRNYASAVDPPDREVNEALIAHVDGLDEAGLRAWLAAGAVLPE